MPLKKIIKDAIARHDEHHREYHGGAARAVTRDDASRTLAAAAMQALAPCGRRMRATDAADKEARRASILNAAESLFRETHEYANVSDVARAAGLAKGTVYLYFQTKEEMYLALHMRNAVAFFSELVADLEAGFPRGEKKRVDLAYMREIVGRHMFDNELYFPLVAVCVGLPEGSVPTQSAFAFRQLLTSWLLRAGAGLERHYPQLQPGDGVRLLNHSYALMIGLFHLLGDVKHAPQRPKEIGLSSFRDEAMIAISRYWQASLGNLNLT